MCINFNQTFFLIWLIQKYSNVKTEQRTKIFIAVLFGTIKIKTSFNYVTVNKLGHIHKMEF